VASCLLHQCYVYSGRRFSFPASAFTGGDAVAGKSSLARVGVGSGAAGDAHAELGSTAMGARRWRRIGNGIAQMDACIER